MGIVDYLLKWVFLLFNVVKIKNWYLKYMIVFKINEYNIFYFVLMLEKINFFNVYLGY